MILWRTVTCMLTKMLFLLSGGDPADFLLHVEPCQRIRFIWWADLRLYSAISVCVCVVGRSVSLGCVPFVSNAKKFVSAVAGTCVSACTHAHRYKGVKLDGGLLKVIMSKVPFSQDEHFAANGSAAGCNLILTSPSFFPFFFFSFWIILKKMQFSWANVGAKINESSI